MSERSWNEKAQIAEIAAQLAIAMKDPHCYVNKETTIDNFHAAFRAVEDQIYNTPKFASKY